MWYRIQNIPVMWDNDGSEAREKALQAQLRPLVHTPDSFKELLKELDDLAEDLHQGARPLVGPEFLVLDSLSPRWPPEGSRTWSYTSSHPFAPHYEPIWPKPFWKSLRGSRK